MTFTFAGKFLAALLLTLAAAPAAAQIQPRTLEVAPNRAWGHAETGMILPTPVAGLTRGEIRDNGVGEMDVVANYANREEGIIGLVYIYRIGAGDLPLWFDRAVATIMLPQAGAAWPAITQFARPGATLASGLRAAMSDNVAGMRSTAMAIAPLAPGWLIKVRMGSTRLDPAALAERLTVFMAGLRWPAEASGARVAVPVEACPEPLRLREARIVNPGGADVLMDAIISSMPPERGRHEAPPPVYCREPGATVERGAYRPDRSTRSYLIAANDAGLAIGVGDVSELSALIGNSGRRFSVTLYERNGTSIYPSFNRLPPLDQAWRLVNEGHPLSATSGNNVTISTGALGH